MNVTCTINLDVRLPARLEALIEAFAVLLEGSLNAGFQRVTPPDPVEKLTDDEVFAKLRQLGGTPAPEAAPTVSVPSVSAATPQAAKQPRAKRGRPTNAEKAAKLAPPTTAPVADAGQTPVADAGQTPVAVAAPAPVAVATPTPAPAPAPTPAAAQTGWAVKDASAPVGPAASAGGPLATQPTTDDLFDAMADLVRTPGGEEKILGILASFKLTGFANATPEQRGPILSALKAALRS